ncbi:nucleoside hydrolase [Corynebacterium pseudopelargi]|uniref:Pyrimidine-specific ribonucleoside hydrolase RihA n=1 Tax=Corynebacterium pseudopelargi TaxID=2080757 RepID=A0A3G6ISB9_9CORY|nr:nucleoside hydrolase [Corynebacterium pseudopelargi]AZA08463.1 Pyrimidine-specific ribonucleoside hydrolase RihA [Corynebacterium pseudopelargi]
MPKVIYDCDPGHDDAVALLLAWGNPDIELLGVSTVAGNQTLEKVTNNARALARVAGISGVPFAAGADRPLLGPQLIPEEIHGDSGLDGPQLPAPGVELDPRHAVNLIADLVREHAPGEITLVPTGALTNIALFARMYPELIQRVGGITLMGGGHHSGNMTPAAEFNILADPEAARIVFEAAWPITMVGLDVTHQVLAVPERLAQLQGVGTDVSQFVAELIEFFGQAYMQERGYPGPPMHDPLAMAAVADPSVLRTVAADIYVETQGDYARGQTIVDFRTTWDDGEPARLGVRDAQEGTPRHRVAMDVDREKFWTLLVDALERIGNTNFA